MVLLVTGDPPGHLPLTFLSCELSTLVGQQRLDRFHHLTKLRKASSLMLRVDQVSVHRNLEGAAGTGH